MPAQCPRVTSDLDSSVLIISSLEDLRHLRSVATHDDVLHGRGNDGVGVVGGVLGLVLAVHRDPDLVVVAGHPVGDGPPVPAAPQTRLCLVLLPISPGGIELHSDSLLIDQLGANLQLGEVVHILSPTFLVFNIHVVNCIGLKQTPGGRM